MPDTTPKYSDADIDRIVGKRLAEREQANIVDALSKELTSIRREIASANHVKRTLGKQLAELNDLVRAHVKQPMHPGTAERFLELEQSFQKAEVEFGLENLTPEERAAFPTVVRTVLAAQARVNEQKQQEKEHAEDDTRHWQKVAAICAAVAVAVSILSATGIFTWLRSTVFHLPT